jgi:hypothetical protein
VADHEVSIGTASDKRGVFLRVRCSCGWSEDVFGYGSTFTKAGQTGSARRRRRAAEESALAHQKEHQPRPTRVLTGPLAAMLQRRDVP